ncbi:putative glutathione S-transferase [Rhodotorula diobovata]|uniref:Putative glutathione S-transferase n=1 Tax=Rhodotorula diobovata TaxID=5288 RepID=A0A5C5G7C1_9BASI|nr:putative glutathione S-transferase [Rhodotorula diobovata]
MSMNTEILAQGPKELNNPGLVLLLAQTPNAGKVTYLTEELKALGKIPGYTVVPISFSKNEQKTPWFEQLNPNGRMPALLDNRESKSPIRVFESMSILLYIAKTCDTDGAFWFKDDEDLQTELVSWLAFTHGGTGPMQGQANHFFRYAPEKIPYGIKRYQDETRRLYSVYEAHLSGKHDGQKKEWLVGGRYTIADMNAQPWVRMAFWAGVELDEFPNVSAWVERIEQRPATQAALKIPEQDKLSQLKADPEAAERMAQQASKWIMEGQNK